MSLNSNGQRLPSLFQVTREPHKKMGDILSHLIPHVRLMDPKQLRREVLTVFLKLHKQNTISPPTLRSILAHIKRVVEAEDSKLPEEVTSLALWLEGLNNIRGDTTTRHYSHSDLENPDEVNKDKTPGAIIDCLHLDYGFQFFGLTWNEQRGKILVGSAHNKIPYITARHIAAELPVDIYIDEGTNRGGIKWINGQSDQVCYRPSVLSTPIVVDRVYTIFPGQRIKRLVQYGYVTPITTTTTLTSNQEERKKT